MSRFAATLLKLLNVCVALLSTLGPTAQAAGLHFLEPDLTLPGASARFGWGGGFFNGAWNELLLEAHGSGTYHLKLGGREGSVRNGYVPFVADLELPDGVGVRSAKMLVPVFSRQAIELRLEGPEGAKTTRLEPLSESRLVVGSNAESGTNVGTGPSGLVYGPALPANPALWLAQPELLISEQAPAPSPGVVLAALAAGGQVLTDGAVDSLKRIPMGRLGLGSRQTKGFDPTRSRWIATVLEHLPAPTHQLMRPGFRLGWWLLAVFTASLLVLMQRKDRPGLWGAASVSAVCAVVGLWTWQPEVERNLSNRFVIGSGGWGLEVEIGSQARLQAGTLRLPPAAQPLQAMAREHTQDGTTIRLAAWKTVRYWLPPRARVLPLRIVNNSIKQQIKEPILELFVVGRGPQEVLGQSQGLKTIDAPPSDALLQLVAVLPPGTALARTRFALYIALPEQT